MQTIKDKNEYGIGWILDFAGSKKKFLVISCFFSVCSAVLSFGPYISIYYIIQGLLSGGSNQNELLRYVWVAFGCAAGSLLLMFVSSLIAHSTAFHIVYGLRMKFAEHIARLPMGFHTANSTGKLRRLMDENTEKVEQFVAHQLPDIIGALIAPVVLFVILFVFDWRMGLACLVPVVLSFVALGSSMMNPKTMKHMQEIQGCQEDMNNSAVEYVRGISVVKAFNQTVYSFRKFYDVIEKYRQSSIDYTYAARGSYCAFILLINSVFLFLLPVGILIGSHAANYQAFAVTFLFYLVLSMGIAAPINKLMYVFTQGTMVQVSIGRLAEVFKMPEQEDGGMSTPAEKHDIQFEHVSFSYNENDVAGVLHDVSFLAPTGKVTALVGPSGSGKSTIAQLIPRFWDVQEGRVLIGGQDVRKLETNTLMRQVSFVFQDVFLFNKSIIENIKIGNPDASDEAAVAAAKAAQCHEFVSRLPNGYHTVLGSKGTYLSGGERQRVVIARAILRDAPIVVLDEATSFADPENEQKIQAALERLMAGKTVVIIAHRLSTIQNADRILVVEDGRIVEQGRHASLLDKNGKYKTMWDAYSSALQWKLA